MQNGELRTPETSIYYYTTDGGVEVNGFNSNATNLVLNGTVTYNGTTYNVVSIRWYAFQNCTSLMSVGDLSACTSIGEYAFVGCTSLTSVGDLPACTSIDGYAFSGCTNLTSVRDLSACTSIGNSAFEDCTSLEKINLTAPNVAELSSSNAFRKNTTIFVPASLLEAYKAADNWKDIANQILPIGV